MTIADTDVGDGHAISVDGHPAPSVSIQSVVFSDIDSNGAGEFTFHLECSTAISSNDCDMLTCSRVCIGQDTYGSSLQSDLAALTFDNTGASVDSEVVPRGYL